VPILHVSERCAVALWQRLGRVLMFTVGSVMQLSFEICLKVLRRSADWHRVLVCETWKNGSLCLSLYLANVHSFRNFAFTSRLLCVQHDI